MAYNVAGLPAAISSSKPAENTPRIGELLTAYDIVAVQEDFNYHAALYASDKHEHRTPTSGGVPFGDGLSLLSNLSFDGLMRNKWKECTEADCLTPKGFFVVQLELAPGVSIDLYNLHTNAGSSDDNKKARRANLAQLAQRAGAAHAQRLRLTGCPVPNERGGAPVRPPADRCNLRVEAGPS